jgi:hypothetical protein
LIPLFCFLSKETGLMICRYPGIFLKDCEGKEKAD